MNEYQIYVARRAGETFDGKPRYMFWFRTEWNDRVDDVKSQVAAFRATLGDVKVTTYMRKRIMYDAGF